MKEMIDIRKIDFSFFGKGSVLNGVFSLKGTTHLNARLDGEVTMEDEGRFVIEDNGVFTGGLKGRDVDIFGSFEGTLTASGRIVIHPTAKVSGDIKASQLVIHPGSSVNINADTEDAQD